MNKMFLAAVMLSGCGFMVDDADAIRAAETIGMSGVRIAERHEIAPGWFGCSDGAAAGFEVKATSAAGKPINAVVCCGAVLKGCTVRSR